MDDAKLKEKAMMAVVAVASMLPVSETNAEEAIVSALAVTLLMAVTFVPSISSPAVRSAVSA